MDRAKAYADAGVDIASGNALVKRLKELADSTKIRGVVAELGGFGGLFRPDLQELEQPLLVASTDGVGTKLKLAFAWGINDTVGIDLVAMSANDVLVQGAAPLFFLDYFACGKLDPQLCATVVGGVAAGCRQAGCALLGGETAEMPDMYPPGEYDLAGFCVGLVDSSRLVDGAGIQPGDAILGLASTGIHSNGFSLVRKILASSELGPDDPFPGEPERTVAQVLLAPTRIYVESVRPLLRDLTIKGMVHVTGGGFYDNLPRVLPERTAANLEFASWIIPPVFEWLKRRGHLTWEEMLQIFNCGIGYIIVLPQTQAEEAISRVRAMNVEAWQIGVISKRGQDAAGAWEEQVQIRFP